MANIDFAPPPATYNSQDFGSAYDAQNFDRKRQTADMILRAAVTGLGLGAGGRGLLGLYRTLFPNDKLTQPQANASPVPDVLPIYLPDAEKEKRENECRERSFLRSRLPLSPFRNMSIVVSRIRLNGHRNAPRR